MFDSEINTGRLFQPLFEGDGGDGGAGDGGGSGDGGAGTGAGQGQGGQAGGGTGGGTGNSGGVTFNDAQQTHINKLMADQKRSMQQKFQSQLDEMTTKLNDAGTAAEQRDAYASELDTIKSTLRTAEEQAEHERTKLVDGHKKVVDELTTGRDQWKNLYTDTTISRSLLDAAVANEAVSPTQIEAILRTKTELVDAIDKESGKKTGQLVPQVSITLPDKDGNPQELKLSPADAVARMKEATNLYGNLFKSTAAGGLGGTGSDLPGQGGTSDLQKLASDPEAYRKARKEGKVPGVSTSGV